MSSKLLQLSLYVVTVIQLTSSQSTYDVIQQENDVNSCGHTDQVLTQLVTTVSQLRSVVSQLQRDVAKIKTPGECPADSTHMPSVNACYKVVTSKLNWTTAGQECRSVHPDAHLLVINDALEQLAVNGMLVSISQDTKNACFTHSHLGITYWTAGQRIDPNSASTFVWRVTSADTNSNTTSAMSYTNWNAGEPNFLGNIPESCMHLVSVWSYAWNDFACSNQLCSICELNI